jgi:type IV secretion system protein VirD4
MTAARKALLVTTGLVTVTVAASTAATQFVAYRVHYHPMLGVPWFGHAYAPWAWAQWMQAPWAANAKSTFSWLNVGFMGVAIAGLLAGLSASNARRKPIKHGDVHGSARFMTEEAEIRGTGLLVRRHKPHAGVYVGGWTDPARRIQYLRHDGPEHAIVVAPTRSGKGVGNILPTLLSWPASTLVYDEKGELWALTAGWRSGDGGNTVIRWEPGAVDGSAGFNFLEEVRIGTPFEVSDAQNIAQAICDPRGEGLEGKDHWTKTSFALITGMILHVRHLALARGTAGTLADLATMLSDPARDANALWDEMLNSTHPVVAAAGRDMLDRPEKERGSVLSSAKVYMTLFADPLVARNTARSDFRLIDLMNADKPVSLYIVTRGADKERLRPLVRLLLTMAMRQLMGVELRYENGQAIMPHRHRLLALLDEFPSLGRMEVIEGSLPKAAGYGIKFFLAAQNREQLFQAYGPHQSITGNCHIRIIYAPNEGSTADWISHDIGNTTIVKEDVTESGLKSGSLKNVSRTYHEVSRPVMTPDEIMALRKPRKDDDGRIVETGEMVVFIAGERPIKGTQILYFIDPTFSERSRIAAPRSGTTIPLATATRQRFAA